jgi:hypothetical protein
LCINKKKKIGICAGEIAMKTYAFFASLSSLNHANFSSRAWTKIKKSEEGKRGAADVATNYCIKTYRQISAFA